MTAKSDVQTEVKNVEELIQNLSIELKELYTFRDLFFENHSIEMATQKDKFVEEKKKILADKFEALDESDIPLSYRAQFLYIKGRCFNISPTYDAKATQCLSKAVKLNPHLVDAWNELGECYWKNMNVKDAKASFEGALKHERNRLSLRCLSIILRQESGDKNCSEAAPAITKSVELAKEAVSLDIKDGVSWTVLGNAYLCKFFTVAQDPATLKLCMSAYKQAWLDPIAKGQPDLYYNKGIALKYEECYHEALEDFNYACRLDPPWEPPQKELVKLVQYVTGIDELVRTKGKIKSKKLAQMVQSIDKRMLGMYGPGNMHTFGTRPAVELLHVRLDTLDEGINRGKVVIGKVVGSIHNENAVPFSFAIVDEGMLAVCVTVYNWADGRGAIIGDTIAIPEPHIKIHTHESDLAKYNFKSIRINNPMYLLVNGKKVGLEQYASTKVTSTYEIH